MRGSVRKATKGCYSIRYDVGVKPDGTRRQRYESGFDTERDAERALAERLTALHAGTLTDPTRTTVKEYATSWLDMKSTSLRPSTLAIYKTLLVGHLVPIIGGTRLADLRAEHLDVVLDHMRRNGTSPGLQRHVIRVTHSMLATAVKRRTLPYNPADQIELPTAPRPERAVWDAGQVGTFLAATRTERDHAVFHLLAMTGMRRGEVLGLRWQDVNLDLGRLIVAQTITDVDGVLHIGPPKSRRSNRAVALDAGTVAVLRAQRTAQAAERLAAGPAWQDHGLVFAREDGTPMRPNSVSQRFELLRKRVGLPKMPLHSLRHTHATLALSAGVSLKTVSERLGHSSYAFTADTYAHVLPEQAQDAADMVARLIEGTA